MGVIVAADARGISIRADGFRATEPIRHHRCYRDARILPKGAMRRRMVEPSAQDTIASVIGKVVRGSFCSRAELNEAARLIDQWQPRLSVYAKVLREEDFSIDDLVGLTGSSGK